MILSHGKIKTFVGTCSICECVFTVTNTEINDNVALCPETLDGKICGNRVTALIPEELHNLPTAEEVEEEIEKIYEQKLEEQKAKNVWSFIRCF